MSILNSLFCLGKMNSNSLARIGCFLLIVQENFLPWFCLPICSQASREAVLDTLPPNWEVSARTGQRRMASVWEAAWRKVVVVLSLKSKCHWSVGSDSCSLQSCLFFSFFPPSLLLGRWLGSQAVWASCLVFVPAGTRRFWSLWEGLKEKKKRGFVSYSSTL